MREANVRCRKCGKIMGKEKVDYDHIHWGCICGYKEKTYYAKRTRRVNPYETKFSHPVLDLERGGAISLFAEEDRKVELLSLEEISRLTASSEPLPLVLADIVKSIARRMQVEVCSIYLMKRKYLVLTATHGLSEKSVGVVKLKPGEGITGAAALSDGPIVVSDASADDRYKYFAVTEEEKYKGMLSCPIRDGDQLLGVLNVQTVKMHFFNPFEMNYINIVSNLIRNCLKIRGKKR